MANHGNVTPVVYLCRKETFCSSHRLHNAKLSEEENQYLYGKCNNLNGHGHNYTVEVTLRGPVNAQTGMVMNISDLKSFMQKAIMDVLDHKNIDKDVPYFQDVVSTAENISIFIWKNLEKLVPRGLLYEVRLHETEKNVAIYRGESK